MLKKIPNSPITIRLPDMHSKRARNTKKINRFLNPTQYISSNNTKKRLKELQLLNMITKNDRRFLSEHQKIYEQNQKNLQELATNLRKYLNEKI